MTGDCQRIRESLAAGESSEVHLEGCPGCAAFARDLARLREAASGLPRPLLSRDRRPRALPSAGQGRRALVALATAASIALAVGLVLRDRSHTVPPSRALDARAPAAGIEERLDLLTTLAKAREVYAPSARAGRSWLALPNAEVGRAIEIDPLASLQAAALLIEQEAPNPRRRR